jgi:hypothetical protein
MPVPMLAGQACWPKGCRRETLFMMREPSDARPDTLEATASQPHKGKSLR